MALLNLDNDYCTGINLYIFGIIMCVVIGYLYGMKRFEEDVTMMLGHRPSCYWRITWRYLSPLFLVFMSIVWIINKGKEWTTEPEWTATLGWMISMSTVVMVPLYALYVMCREPTGLSCASYRRLIKPNAEWGPAREENRVGRYRPLDVETDSTEY